ncbi:MAG: O-antigen ligase family protein [Desulfobacterium sp.]|nr:O-antigen ligase family protein [Desulfobacterium sp.]
MGKLLLVALILFAGAAALARPWIGIVSYYLLSTLGPQYIWWWVFEGLRVSLIVALSTLFGISLSAMRHNYDFNFLLNKQNFWLGFLWFCILVSYIFGPYVASFSSSGLNPSQLFSLTNTIFLFYFCAALEMNEVRKLRYLVIVFAVSTIYLIYWANAQYFSGNWSQFNMGRLMGPRSIHGGTIYNDENAFAMLFVTGLPFIYYLGFASKNWFVRLGLWAIIPLGWHAVFLTGSRGGLVGLIVVMGSVIMTSKRRMLMIPLLLMFVFFYQWQSGDIMDDRSQMIAGYEGDKSAEDRLNAWAGGFKMLEAHPITGVGLGSFITALPLYHESRPMVAHNTFVQFAAESGAGAGLAYLMSIWIFFRHYKKIKDWCLAFPDEKEMHQIDMYNHASATSFVGLFVCSMFLSLNVYEVFFLLILFNNALYQICLRKEMEAA